MNVSELLRKQPKIAVVATAIAVALGAGAQQQEPTRENANRPQPSQSAPQTNQSSQVARSDAGMQTLKQYLQSKTLRVSKLVGMELQTRSGDNLGEVHDVLRGTTPGQDMQLIVQTGGVGADEKLIALPFDDVQVNADGDELYTTRTREQLASAPAVQLEQRTAGNATPAQRSAAETSREAANRDAANRGAAPQAGGEPRTTQPATPGQRSAATTTSSQQRIADLVGAEVVGSGGDKVGEVDDIVISTAGADSIRAVLQVGGIAGVGEKRISLPLSQINVERSADDNEPTLRVAMDGDSLQRLPEFEYEEDTAAL
ncbi:MAG TPA: PRC-barrel domain-containing protein [Gammaproteobacteria bacterium]|nr:PRC-barrel domain-containing protein [Gammaproteobacteria bacterium]